MDIQERLYTVDEYLEIARLPENEAKRLELIEGVIVEMAGSSKKNTVIALRIGRHLGSHVDDRHLGYVSGPDGAYQIAPNTVLLPDAGFIRLERAQGLEGVVFPVAPDLAVEVISPSETSRDVVDKARAYLKAGTQQVWAIFPAEKIVDVYRLGENDTLIIQTLTIADTLSGNDLLPGFTLPLTDLFPD